MVSATCNTTCVQSPCTMKQKTRFDLHISGVVPKTMISRDFGLSQVSRPGAGSIVLARRLLSLPKGQE